MAPKGTSVKGRKKNSVKIISKMITPTFKIKIGDDYQELKKGTILYVVDNGRPYKKMPPGKWILCPQIPKNPLERWCWQFKIGDNGKLEGVKGGNPKYNGVYCVGAIWTAKSYNIYIKDCMDIVNKWGDSISEDDLIKKTLVHPSKWKEEIKDKPGACFQDIMIKHTDTEVLLDPGNKDQVWSIKLEGFEKIDPEMGGSFRFEDGDPVEHFQNFALIEFSIEVEAILEKVNKTSSDLTFKSSEIKKYEVKISDKLDRNFLKKQVEELDKMKKNDPSKYKKFIKDNYITFLGPEFDSLDNINLDFYNKGVKGNKLTGSFNKPPEESVQKKYFRPKSSSPLYSLKKDGEIIWVLDKNINKGDTDNSDINYKYIKLDWKQLMYDILDISANKSLEICYFSTGSVKPFHTYQSIYIDLIFQNNQAIYLKDSGDEMKFSYKHIWNANHITKPKIQEQYKNKLDDLIQFSYVYTTKRKS